MDLKRIFALKGDRQLWYLIIALMICSLVLVYSATGRLAFSQGADSNIIYYLRRQFFLLVGCGAVLLATQHISWRIVYGLSKLALILSVVLLLITCLHGEQVNNAERGLFIPLIGITVQSSEIAKVAIIVYMARLLSDYQEVEGCPDTVLRQMWLPAVAVLLIFLENFSTSVLIGITCWLMLFIGRLRLKVIGILTASILGVVLLVFLAGVFIPGTRNIARVGTMVSRVSTFLGMEAEEVSKDANYQTEQAKIAVASGGVLGRGPGNSIQRNFLPNAFTDYIYALIIEQHGLIGGIVILALYMFILFRVGIICRRCLKTDHLNPRGAPCFFPAFTVAGLGICIVLQAFFHMAVNLSMLPVTGQNLPMISMGGTSLLLTSVAFGIILGMARDFPVGEKAGREEAPVTEAAGEETEEVRQQPRHRRMEDGRQADGEETPPADGKDGPARKAPRGRRGGPADGEEGEIKIIGDLGWNPDEAEEGGREVLEKLGRRGRRNEI